MENVYYKQITDLLIFECINGFSYVHINNVNSIYEFQMFHTKNLNVSYIIHTSEKYINNWKEIAALVKEKKRKNQRKSSKS